ncbi:high affinity choline transporter 1-like isoform X2 [Phyllopteryx taeniolatus]|uniref:high affinity choline transporter 1-like isoform X2 n=1 Tax=Phyllopteryx taeniolatus TaxID=161469 RepID=UPI002AD4CDCA|nr:high affinity choline transporter 1-like isoform X2 [Phyllopteryx taeniolatus]
MTLNVEGLVVMAAFYLLILGTGIWASMRSRREEKKCQGDGMEITLLAGRNINLLVGVFTLTATWVGGGFILGIAEATYNPTLGAVWALMPVPYVVTFFLGGTMAVILDLSYAYSIIISAVVAIVYTLLGGLYSVAYTDVIQLILIFVSLWVCVPFLLTNPHSLDISLTAYNQTFQAPWVGTVNLDEAGKWFDDFMLLALGGLAYQAFYQRILAASSYTQAQITCFASSAFCLVLGIPSVLVGAVAASTDWNSTRYGLPTPYERGEVGSILPISLQYLTPTYVSIIGIGAVAAAVMSSMDSALLSSASLFSSNIYKNIIRKQASDREMQWVIRISVVVVGLAGAGLTFLDSSVLVFWLVGVDMSYTIMFPQLVCVLFFKQSNGYGAAVGFLMGITMRILSGEPLVSLPPIIHFPNCRPDAEGKLTQFFPFRTVIMLGSLVTIMVISWLMAKLFNTGLLPEKWDVYKVKDKQNKPVEERTPENNEELSVSKQLLDTTSC